MYPVIEDRDIEGSVYMPKDGQADPVGVTNVLAKAAKIEGVKILAKFRGMHSSNNFAEAFDLKKNII